MGLSQNQTGIMIHPGSVTVIIHFIKTFRSVSYKNRPASDKKSDSISHTNYYEKSACQNPCYEDVLPTQSPPSEPEQQQTSL